MVAPEAGFLATQQPGTTAAASMAKDDSILKAASHEALLTPFPGEEFIAHVAELWQEQTEARLAKRSLLAAAYGHAPAATRSIVDVDLALLPSLPAAHRDHHRREEARLKAHTQNTANAEKRWQITMETWTEIYTALKESTEITAPVLSKKMKDACDLSKTMGIVGGYYDGPLAFRMVLDKMHGSTRTESDKDFYRTCEQAQRSHHLPDHCAASDYHKKALAFLTRLRPYLAQPFTDELCRVTGAVQQLYSEV